MLDKATMEKSAEYPPTACSVKRLKKALVANKNNTILEGAPLLKSQVKDQRRSSRGQPDPEYHKHHALAAEWVEIMQGRGRQAPFFSTGAVKMAVRKGLLVPTMALIECPVVPTAIQGSKHDRRHEVVGQGAWETQEPVGHFSPAGWPDGWLWKTPGVRSRLKGMHGHYTMHVKYRSNGMFKFITNVNDSVPKTFVDPMQGVMLAQQLLGRNVKIVIYTMEV